jgi:hypothetical protein
MENRIMGKNMKRYTFDVWLVEPKECVMSGIASNQDEAIWAVIEYYQKFPELDSNNSMFGIDEE